jgi:transcriptional regulator with XRE-family HTH domain
MSIGERLAVLLKEKGISQKAFSEKIDYREQTISNLITGQTKSPKADLIIEIARFFPEVRLRWLLMGEGEMYIPKSTIDESVQKKLENLKDENSKLKDKIIGLLETK